MIKEISLARYFNPHSRKGSDKSLSDYKQLLTQISIHTPARGVTVPVKTVQNGFSISIHTPARGVTRKKWPMVKPRAKFQSTLPQGE